MSRLYTKPLALAAFVFLVTFIVYQFTLAPTVDFIDAGELATDSFTLGIAHPTGYPLFVLLGWIFSHLPIAATVIGRLNEMAALFTALGAGGMVLLSHEILANWLRKRLPKPAAETTTKQQRKKVSVEPLVEAPISTNDSFGIVEALSLFAGLFAAFSMTWWEQSTAVEVYPVHLFFLPLILYFFLRMVRLSPKTEAKLTREGVAFAVLLGLSFTNHMSTVLLAPGCLYLYFARFGFGEVSWKRIARLALPFLAGLLVYLYLPLRSHTNPLMDWGHPTNFYRFFKHITGGQYKVWMFTKGTWKDNWLYFCSSWPANFAYAGIAAALLGLWGLITYRSPVRGNLLVFTVLLFFGCLGYAVNYRIHDIDSYFLLAYLTTVLWVTIGIYWLASRLRQPMMIAAAISVLLVVAELGFNWKEVDESGNHMVENCTLNTLRNLPQNAIIFSTQWDFWVSGAYYYQLVEKIRPDVLVIDKAMLRDRPFYLSYLHQRAPTVMDRVTVEVAAFLQDLTRFDRGLPFDANRISANYRALTDSLVAKNLDRPIYITTDMIDEDDLFAPSFKRVPAGLYIQLLKEASLPMVPLPTLDWNDQRYKQRNYYTDNTRLFQAMPLAAYAKELYNTGHFEEASSYINAALRFQPDLNQNIETLREKDRNFAETANAQFAAMAQLRAAIEQRGATRK